MSKSGLKKREGGYAYQSIQWSVFFLLLFNSLTPPPIPQPLIMKSEELLFVGFYLLMHFFFLKDLEKYTIQYH